MNTQYWGVLAGAAVKGTVVLLGAWFAGVALKRSTTAARHLVWTAALAALLLLPLFALTLPE